jgi:hypothetical protein
MKGRAGMAVAAAKHFATPRELTGMVILATRETWRGQYERKTALLASFFGQYDILAKFVPGLARMGVLANNHTGHATVL